jgi:hypothetical protein
MGRHVIMILLTAHGRNYALPSEMQVIIGFLPRHRLVRAYRAPEAYPPPP